MDKGDFVIDGYNTASIMAKGLDMRLNGFDGSHALGFYGSYEFGRLCYQHVFLGNRIK